MNEGKIASDSRRISRESSSLHFSAGFGLVLSSHSLVLSEAEGPLAARHCISNRPTYEKLEVGVSDTKQTTEVISNRQS